MSDSTKTHGASYTKTPRWVKDLRRSYDNHLADEPHFFRKNQTKPPQEFVHLVGEIFAYGLIGKLSDTQLHDPEMVALRFIAEEFIKDYDRTLKQQ